MIIILTTGSRGDTQPYIALGLALKKAGQDVRIAAFENYESFVKDYGLAYFPIKGDVSKVAASLGAQKAMQADNPLKFLLKFKQIKIPGPWFTKGFLQCLHWRRCRRIPPWGSDRLFCCPAAADPQHSGYALSHDPDESISVFDFL